MRKLSLDNLKGQLDVDKPPKSELSALNDNFRDSATLELFNSTQGGASGWIGGRAIDESEFAFNVTLELSEAGYTEIEIEDIQEIDNISQAYEFHRHLGKNMENWEPGHRTVWGYLHPFILEGRRQ